MTKIFAGSPINGELGGSKSSSCGQLMAKSRHLAKSIDPCMGELPKNKVQKLSCAKGRYLKFSSYVAYRIVDVQVFFW
jgi:hypothetical protein